MPKVENVRNLKAFFFGQSATGSADATLAGTAYSALLFGATNLIPSDCRVTGFDFPSPSIGVREAEDVEDEDAWIKYETDKISPGQATLNVDRAIDVASVFSTLEELEVDQPFLGVLKIGKFVSVGTGTKVYRIVYSAPALLIEDMGFAGTAKQKLTGSLKFQISGKPKRGSSECSQNATITTATGAIALSTPSP